MTPEIIFGFAILGLINFYAWALGRDFDRAAKERAEILVQLRRLTNR